jgi:hypothetical protein
LQSEELGMALQEGNLTEVLRIYDAQPRSERDPVTVLGFAAARGDREGARRRLERDWPGTANGPWAIHELHTALGAPDPAPAYEALSADLVRQDLAQPFLPDAGVAVLLHVEDYELRRSGHLSSLQYDLRRVSGTTDVDQGAQSATASISGRQAHHLLRRRIYKRDGRVLEPDPNQMAEQDNADLSQLQPGDYVEEIRIGDYLPEDSGHLTLDTPDLLPERQSVRLAEIRLRRPKDLPLQLWVHPTLGKSVDTPAGELVQSTWTLRDAAPRRLEDGIPRMERDVSLSLGTRSWSDLAEAFSEYLRALRDDDPIVSRWVTEAAGSDGATGRPLLDRLVQAVGKQVRVAYGGSLSDDVALGGPSSPSGAARATLEQRQGSRTWLLARALEQLRVPVEIALAETDPWSRSEGYPVHSGRFRKPLLLVHLPEGDTWVDADVDGPPLPPGLISPEIRGRAALLPSGRLLTLPTEAPDTGDVVDVRLTVDEEGNARGECNLLLRGQPAQTLNETFQTTVGTERQSILRTLVLSWLPWADVEDVVLSSAESSWEVRLRATIGMHGYARPEGRTGSQWTLPGLEPVHFSHPHPFAGTLGATVAAQAARDSDLSIGRTMQYELRRRVELPQSMRVRRAPTPISVHDPRISASRTAHHEGNTLEESFRLSLPTGTVPASAYEDFVRHAHTIDDGFLAGTRVERASSGHLRTQKDRTSTSRP